MFYQKSEFFWTAIYKNIYKKLLQKKEYSLRKQINFPLSNKTQKI